MRIGFPPVWRDSKDFPGLDEDLFRKIARQIILRKLKWQPTRLDPDVITANANASFKTAGENVQITRNGTRLSVRSRRNFSLLDNGQNESNVDIFLTLFQRELEKELTGK